MYLVASITCDAIPFYGYRFWHEMRQSNKQKFTLPSDFNVAFTKHRRPMMKMFTVATTFKCQGQEVSVYTPT